MFPEHFKHSGINDDKGAYNSLSKHVSDSMIKALNIGVFVSLADSYTRLFDSQYIEFKGLRNTIPKDSFFIQL